MKFLIAGLGSIGQRHLRNLLALGEKEILLLRTHRSSLPDKDLEAFPQVGKLEDALGQQPDAVIVSNPTALHLDVAIPAAEAGCHLFIEKPLSHNMQAVDRLLKVVEKNKVQVLVGYQFRFHPAMEQIKEIIESGELGRPISAHAHWGEYLPGWHPWEDFRQGYSARADLGGGVVLTLSHPLDYLRWLLGDVVRVCAMTANISPLKLDVEDTAIINLEFENGMIGSVHVDYVQQPPSHYLEVVFERGSLHWNYADGTARVVHAHKGREYSLSPPTYFTRNDMFLAEMKHFIQVLHGEAQPKCSLRDGVRALQIAVAALESAEKKICVELKIAI